MKTRYLLNLPFVSIHIRNEEVEFLLDTGFSGTLVMPLEKILDLDLEPAGLSSYSKSSK